MSLDPTTLKRGQIIRKGKIRYIVLYVDNDGTIFAGHFKRRTNIERWSRITDDLWRYKSTGEVYTVVNHCPRPLMLRTFIIDETENFTTETGRPLRNQYPIGQRSAS